MSKKKILALDCDGVILYYPPAYEIVWERAFGEKLSVVQPHSYHAVTRYGVQFQGDDHMNHFFSHFTADVWEGLPALDGALAACKRLVDADYKLVCVTAMPAQFERNRVKNFENLNIPITDVIATGRSDLGCTKTEVLKKLMPVAFADDLASNFLDLPPGIHKALIHYGAPDAPDPELHITKPDTIHGSLSEFVDYWVSRDLVNERRTSHRMRV